MFYGMCDPCFESNSWTRGRGGPPCPGLLSLQYISMGGGDDIAKIVGMGSLPLMSLLYKAPFLIFVSLDTSFTVSLISGFVPKPTIQAISSRGRMGFCGRN